MREVVITISVLAIAACGNDPRIADARGDSAAATCKMTSAYLQTCQDPSTCMGCNCQIFGHEFYCSPMCTTVADCPAPATACAPNGYCMK